MTPANSGEATMDNPLVHTIAEACAIAHEGRTGIYEAINDGKLRAVKRGRRTLILHDELVRYVQSLPPLTLKRSGTASPKGSGTDHKDGDNYAG
jgi:excisionase family DNA binding protein